MNEFKLEEYKKGVPALDREGKKWWFLVIVPGCENKHNEMISHNGNGCIIYSYTNGNYYGDDTRAAADLISMYRESKKYCVNIYQDITCKYGFSIGDIIYTIEDWHKKFPNGVKDALYIKTIEFEV